MAKSPYRGIPNSGNDIASLRAAIDALQENVEIMQGVREGQGGRGPVNQIFVSATPPIAVRPNDLWLRKVGDTWTIKVWVNGQWQ